MAELSLGESRWRMVRRAVKKKRFKFEDCRNMSRNDLAHFDWLVKNGFFEKLGQGYFTVTDRGKAAADLGFYVI